MFKNFLLTQVYAAGNAIDGGVFPDLTAKTIFIWLVNFIIIIGFGLAFVFLVLGFIKYVTSQGDKTALDQAQKWITYAALGGIGMLAAFTLKTIVIKTVGMADPLKE